MMMHKLEKITEPKYNVKLLQAMLFNYSYSLQLMNDVVIRAKATQQILKNDYENNQVGYHDPQFEKIVLTILGLTQLLSVCEESSKQYCDRELVNKIQDIKKQFDYKNVRDILSHWEDYSTQNGILQKNGKVPKHPPTLSLEHNGAVFLVYDYKIQLLDYYEDILSVYRETWNLLNVEEVKLFDQRNKVPTSEF